jgi:hypothetical protein
MNDSVIEFFRQNKVQHIYIPGGCTGLLQPLDVTINKVFKNIIRYKYETYIKELFDQNENLEQIIIPKKETYFHG